MFDSFKKIFGKSSKKEEKTHQMQLIDEELDDFERDIQEYISYTEHAPSSPPKVAQPENLSRGGAVGKSDIITPEAKKRIENN